MCRSVWEAGELRFSWIPLAISPYSSSDTPCAAEASASPSPGRLQIVASVIQSAHISSTFDLIKPVPAPVFRSWQQGHGHARDQKRGEQAAVGGRHAVPTARLDQKGQKDLVDHDESTPQCQ